MQQPTTLPSHGNFCCTQVRLHLFAHAPDITQLITQRQDSLVLHTIPAICMQHTRLHTCIAGAPSKPFGPLLVS